jgi:hypothetical protein
VCEVLPQDIVSAHLYPGDPDIGNYLNAINGNVNGRAVWLAETGANSGDETAQTAWHQYILQNFRAGSYPGWTRIIFCRMHSGSDCCDESIIYGNYTNKPVFNVYRDWIASHP